MNISNKSVELTFGRDTVWLVEFSDGVQQTPAQPTKPVSDIAASVDEALSAPIEFPPLDQAVVPGDSLVLAVDTAIPSVAKVIAATATWFIKRGTSPENICVVLAENRPDVAQSIREQLAELNISELRIELHDPDDADSSAYVAATKSSDPIYMNRSLVDADVVLPITCGRTSAALDYLGPYSIFPMLSDRATRGRIYNLSRLEKEAGHRRLSEWADQAAWWAGLFAAMQVLPAGAEGIAEIVVAQTESLDAIAQRRMSELWEQPSTTSDLVIALIDCDPVGQSWLTASRALNTATKCASHGASIVLCTQLRQPIGSGLKRLRQTNKSPEEVAQQLSTDAYDDALAAAVILQATADHHVYLKSELRKDSVESLGLGVLETQDQLTQLAGAHGSACVLRSAQHIGVSSDQLAAVSSRK